MLTFCCDGLKSLANNRNKNGFSLEVYSDEDQPSFWIIMRAVPKEQMKSVIIDAAPPKEVLFWTRSRIFFCPWCGRKLDKFYKKNWKSLFSPIKDFSTPVNIEDC